MGKSVFRNIVGTYQNRSSLETFYGDNLISKNFKILSLAKSFLIETQDYSLESRIVPNSIIDDFIKKQGYLENIQKNICSGALF